MLEYYRSIQIKSNELSPIFFATILNYKQIMSFEYFKIIFHGSKYKLLYSNLRSISIYLKIKLINKNNKINIYK